MKDHGPKVRLSRRFGVPLTPKAARIMERRPNPPGQHVRNRRPQQESDYKKQLTQKQLLRCQYNIRERQMRRYYDMALKSRGNSAERLVQLLETRLDVLVLRAGFAPTIYAARQAVSHGHIQVNRRKVDIPSYRVRAGDEINVRPKSEKLAIFQLQESQAAPLQYLQVTPQDQKAMLLREPQASEAPVVCELSRVIEFYSR